MEPTTLIIFYASLALGASFLCSILEAVLLSTTHGHIVALKETHPKISKTWGDFKDDPEGPLTAILTLNTIAHTVGALGVGHETEAAFGDAISHTWISKILAVGGCSWLGALSCIIARMR